jgi:hypothetical protein
MALGVVCVNAAHAQLSDNFDSYANGTVLNNINGWQGWDNVLAACGEVSNAQSNSAPNSVAIDANSDCVNQLGNPTSGKWDVTVDQYIPAGSGGNQYFIMNNIYNDGGPYNWSIELLFSGATGLVTDDFDATVSMPILYDQWVPIRMIIDLDNDTVDQYYDGMLLGAAGQSWTGRGSGAGANAIGAVDLFSNGAQTIYYDNFSLAVFVEAPVTVPAESLTVAPGILNAGGLPELENSDNQFVQIFRNPGGTTAVTQFVITGTSPTASPSALEFTLEGKCVSRPNVVQRIELFNYQSASYEVVDERNANRTPNPDLTVVVTATGDLSRFVDQTTLEMQARVRYRADIPRAGFSSNTDQAIWTVTP